MSSFSTIDDLDLKNKTALVRVDINVPMKQGHITDETRIRRIVPTIRKLLAKKAKVIIISHFDRPEGKYVPHMSLAPLVDALSRHLGQEVKFGVDCIGTPAQEAAAALKPGDVLLLENLRFHPGEEANDQAFSKELASIADFYVNDAFSCSHRAHASIVGVAEILPSAAGLLMQEELEALETIFSSKGKIGAVIGGSKVSTKLELLESLIHKTSVLIIGGGMANTFLQASGWEIGASLSEPKMLATARQIIKEAEKAGCEIVLPVDAVCASELAKAAPCEIVSASPVQKDMMILDIGPATASIFNAKILACDTLVWNGPMGAFETSPFDVGTFTLARAVAAATKSGKLKSIGGGGDTVSALTSAGVIGSFTYVSTAGGAFLEWLEGKILPGVAAIAWSGRAQRGATANILT